MAVHIVIFGLSGHSLYAETGTAINRLCYRMCPCFVVTITAVLPAKAPLSEPNRRPVIKDLATIDATTNPTTTESATKTWRKRALTWVTKSCALLQAVVANFRADHGWHGAASDSRHVVGRAAGHRDRPPKLCRPPNFGP